MLKSERGVTLIEMVLALAIAGILAASITFGRDNLRTKQQFSQGVDQAVSTISDVRNQAATTVGQEGNVGVGTGGGTGEVIYGKFMTINSAGVITVQTETVIDGTAAGVAFHNTYNTSIPWTVAPSSIIYLLFGIQNDGSINAFWSTTTHPAAGGAENSGMTQINAATGPKSFLFRDIHGKQANITIDQYGDVSRVYL